MWLGEIYSFGIVVYQFIGSVVSHLAENIPRRALLENSLVFFTWTGFKPAVRKDGELSAKRLMQPLDARLLKEFGPAMYTIVSARGLFGYGRHQRAPNSLCSRDVRHLLVAGHFVSDLGCEVRNRVEVTLEKLKSVDATIQNRTVQFIKDSTAYVTIATILRCFYSIFVRKQSFM